jgi:NAD(P)-dependent dehydrogenase (short-subunit alcohol dehydrogenase family)
VARDRSCASTVRSVSGALQSNRRRAVQQHMTEARWGRIVNLSSICALGNRG